MTNTELADKIEALLAKVNGGEWDGQCPGDMRGCEAPDLCQEANCCFREGDDFPLGGDPRAFDELKCELVNNAPAIIEALRKP